MPDKGKLHFVCQSLPHGKIPWGIASIVTLALAAVSCVHFHKPPPPAAQVIQATIDAPPKTRITNFTISPDGRNLAGLVDKGASPGAPINNQLTIIDLSGILGSGP